MPRRRMGTVRVWVFCIVMLMLISCSTPNDVLAPRETSAALLYITPAATLDINATVTAYAEGIIPSPTPSGMYIVKSGDTLSAIADDSAPLSKKSWWSMISRVQSQSKSAKR